MDTNRSAAEESEKGARVATLLEEANAIHFANQLYWKLKDHSPEASAEYTYREGRLEEITRALAAAKPRAERSESRKNGELKAL